MYVTFYIERGSPTKIWKYIVAEAFFVNWDFQRRKFITFYPERVGSPTKIWKYIIAKGVRGHFLKLVC